MLENTLFIIIIIGVAIVAASIEIAAIHNYRVSQLGTTAEAIKRLENYQQQEKQNVQPQNWSNSRSVYVDDRALKWLLKHIDGKITGATFKPRRENDSFVLLSFPSILSKPIPRSPVYFAPGLLTTLGILGTFSGISFGLHSVNLKDFSDTEPLLNASTELLMGMKQAFSTSLWGLGSASVFMLLLAVGASLRQKYRNQLRTRLSDVAFVESPGRIISRLDKRSNHDSAETLKEVADSLGGLNQFNPDNMGKAIGNAIKEAIFSSGSPLIKELQQIQLSCDRQLTSISQKLDPLTPEAIATATSAQLQGSIAPISHQIEQIIQQQEKLDTSVHNFRTQLIDRLDTNAQLTQEISQALDSLSLPERLKSIENFQQDTLIKLQQFATNLQSILAQFSNDTQGVMQQVATEIQQAVDLSIAGMEAQRSAFEESASKAAIAFQNQSQTLEKLGDRASQLINEARENFVSTLGNIDETLQNTSKTVQQESEQFRLSYQLCLQKFFNEQNDLLNDTLGKQREGLVEVVNNLEHTFKQESDRRQKMTEQVNESLSKINVTVENVNNLASSVVINSSQRLEQLQKLACTIGNEADKVENAYKNMTEQFKEALKIGNEQLNSYLSQANESYTRSLEEADRSAARVCSELNNTAIGINGAANELVRAAHYLVAATDDINNTNGNRHKTY